MTKDQRQAQIVEKWLTTLCGTLEAVTGFGKTRVAILIILRMLKKPGRTTLVIVPSKKLHEDWTHPVHGHIVKWGLTGVTVVVINTAIKHTYTCDLLILDEIHNYAAEQFYTLFQKVSYRWILGLTATIDRLDGKHTLLTKRCPVFDTVGLQEAQQTGYISKFLTINLAVKFSLSEQRLYNQATNQMNAMFGRFGQDFDLAKNCQGIPSVREAFARQQGWTASLGDDHPWSPRKIAYYAVMWNKAIQARKKLLYQSTSKLLAAQAILNLAELAPMKTITFSESTDFADELTRLFPTTSRAYHSNIKSTVESYEKVTTYKTKPNKIEHKTRRVSGSARNKQALLDLSNPSSPVRIINTAKALDEGFDVADIELALICSSTSSPRQNIQRTGRAVRFVVGKTALIINLYHPDTQDERWLNKRQKNKQAIWLSEISDITRYVSGSSPALLL